MNNYRTIEINSEKYLVSGESEYYMSACENGVSLGHLEVALGCIPKKSGIFFDIGANIGITSFLLNSLFPGSTIYSFEPHPRTYEFLKRNIEANTATVNSTVFIPENVGLSSENATLKFRDNPKCDTGNSLISDNSLADRGMKTINVDVTKGDDYMKSLDIKKIDFMKIDVEGYEVDVLRGFIKNLNAIETVLLEFNHWCLSFYRELLPTTALFEISLYFDYIFGSSLLHMGNGLKYSPNIYSWQRALKSCRKKNYLQPHWGYNYPGVFQISIFHQKIKGWI